MSKAAVDTGGQTDGHGNMRASIIFKAILVAVTVLAGAAGASSRRTADCRSQNSLRARDRPHRSSGN